MSRNDFGMGGWASGTNCTVRGMNCGLCDRPHNLTTHPCIKAIHPLFVGRQVKTHHRDCAARTPGGAGSSRGGAYVL